jgi:subfamily B ATP-binding cassette protein MsbA
MGGAERTRGSRLPEIAPAKEAGGAKRKVTAGALEEARGLIWQHRRRLGLGLALMLVNRLAGLVLPATSKWLMDEVVAKQRWELLGTLALAAGAATLVESATSFALSQVLGVAAQRAITNMRKQVEAHVMRLPIRYFDQTKSGILISRIMTDAEGIRNLVGTGLVQLTGSVITAMISLGVLFYLNWQLTAITILILASDMTHEASGSIRLSIKHDSDVCPSRKRRRSTRRAGRRGTAR